MNGHLKIDWHQIIANLRTEISTKKIGEEIDCSRHKLNRIAGGEKVGKQVRLSREEKTRLLDLHYDYLPELHTKKLITYIRLSGD